LTTGVDVLICFFCHWKSDDYHLVVRCNFACKY